MKDKRESELLSSNNVKLISVSNRIIFVRNNRSNSYDGKIAVKNQSARYVSFVVRSTDILKFRIKPRYYFIPPGKTIEVAVRTRNVTDFHEISQDFFVIFVVPIYDKRQLDKKKLRLLWRAHGTDIFPYESTEFHKISYILPRDDSYFGNLSIISRILAMSHVTRKGKPIMNEQDPVDEETFHLNWPKEGPLTVDDPSLEQLLTDWHAIAKKIHLQTKCIIQSAKVAVAVMITGIMTFLTMSYMYLSDAVPFDGWTGVRVGVNGQKIANNDDLRTHRLAARIRVTENKNSEGASTSCVIA